MTTVATAWMVTRLAAPTDALEIQKVDVGEPGANQVRIAVEAFCLDFNDIDTIRGRYGLLRFDPPFVIGMAAAGTVDATGPGCEGLLGRRVVGTTVGVQGAYASAALLDGAMLQLLPTWLGAADGVAMYFPYQLSYLALRVRGRVAPGDVVLVHAAAGGVGSAAVQLAKAFGATVIGTAGTDEKVEFCRSLGADYGVNYRRDDFAAFVDDITNGRGVDVAFDTVGGEVTTQTFRVMAFNGRHLIIGFASGIEAEERPLPMPTHRDRLVRLA
jgi:NADPH:quinone reductase